MSRFPVFPLRLLAAAFACWGLYLVLGLIGWSTFSEDTTLNRFELDVRQLLLFTGWAALTVGLGGWLMAERDRGAERTIGLVETGVAPPSTAVGDPDGVLGSGGPE